jgi:hypothetical protein
MNQMDQLRQVRGLIKQEWLPNEYCAAGALLMVVIKNETELERLSKLLWQGAPLSQRIAATFSKSAYWQRIIRYSDSRKTTAKDVARMCDKAIGRSPRTYSQRPGV